MDLTVREVAAALGCRPRTVRSRIARGEIPATRRGRRWFVSRHDLPLTDAQRRALQARADEVRRTVDAALPSRAAGTPGDRRRSVVDVEAFRRGARLLASLRADPAADAEPAVAHAAGLVEAALVALSEGIHHWDPGLKVERFNTARSQLAAACAHLALGSDLPPPDPVHGWLAELEGRVIPGVAGLTRWAERLGRRAR